jgi:hypothetical protein
MLAGDCWSVCRTHDLYIMTISLSSGVVNRHDMFITHVARLVGELDGLGDAWVPARDAASLFRDVAAADCSLSAGELRALAVSFDDGTARVAHMIGRLCRLIDAGTAAGTVLERSTR